MEIFAKYQSIALVILRFVIAAVFLDSAFAKLFVWTGTPEDFMAPWMVFVTKLLFIVEPLGALALIGGFLTRWASAGLSIIMIGAIFVTQFEMGIGFSTPTGPGWNFALLVLAGCLALLSFGPGKWSVDSMLNESSEGSLKTEQTA